MAKSDIEWTDATWNPVTGCTKISAGCKHCYASAMAKRLQAMGQKNYANGFKLTLQPDMLLRPLSWKRPQVIFVNSMSDLFHDEVPLDYIQQVFAVMNQAHWHRFQVLTKRADRLAAVAEQLSWTPNIWMGVSVENQDVVWRVDALRQVPAHVRFLSCEPLLGPLPGLTLEGIHWVIVGGESGPTPRLMEEAWALDLLEQCQQAKVAFFFKQWGGRNKKKAGRLLLRRTWDELPTQGAAVGLRQVAAGGSSGP